MEAACKRWVEHGGGVQQELGEGGGEEWIACGEEMLAVD